MTNPQQQFIADIYPAAKKIAEESGASLDLILAQTAQETGWGQKTLEGTNNLFNVKADASWHGKTVGSGIHLSAVRLDRVNRSGLTAIATGIADHDCSLRAFRTAFTFVRPGRCGLSMTLLSSSTSNILPGSGVPKMT